MQPLSHLESFLQSADCGSFSAAARRLGQTPAAISKNVARLEASLGVRLFQRSTRKLALTEEGVRFRERVAAGLTLLQSAVDDVSHPTGHAKGTLKVSLGLGFARAHILPLLGEFLERYPDVVPDWHFDNRPVDIVGEGYDAAIGGGFELSPGVVARELAPIHAVLVASPAYVARAGLPLTPADLGQHRLLLRRSVPTGRLRPWTLQPIDPTGVPCIPSGGAASGAVTVTPQRPRAIFSDPEALAEAAGLGYGIALLPLPFVERMLRRGQLLRLLPDWHQPAGSSWLYYPGRELPAKTRVFVDFLLQRLGEQKFAERMHAAHRLTADAPPP